MIQGPRKKGDTTELLKNIFTMIICLFSDISGAQSPFGVTVKPAGMYMC